MIDMATRFGARGDEKDPSLTDILFAVERIASRLPADERRLIRTVTLRYLDYRSKDMLVEQTVEAVEKRLGRKIDRRQTVVDLLRLVSKKDVSLYLRLRAFVAGLAGRSRSKAGHA